MNTEYNTVSARIYELQTIEYDRELTDDEQAELAALVDRADALRVQAEADGQDAFETAVRQINHLTNLD